MELFGNRTETGDPAAGKADDLVTETTTATFVQDVIEASRERVVLVDFWAPWCGPCRQLAPVLEKAVRAARGRVKLVKMNIDDHPQVAGQLGIQSIPAVIAFRDGRPLDGFMGALPESQVSAFIERVAGPPGPSDAETTRAAAEEAFAARDYAAAAQLYGALAQEDPEDAAALAGLARCYLMTGDLQRAEDILGRIPEAKKSDPAVAAAAAQLALAREAGSVPDPTELRARLERDPKDHRARYDLALALAARGDKEAAVGELVEIVRRDRAWNDEAARKRLLQFFEAWGPTDEATIEGRRRLSSVLFS